MLLEYGDDARCTERDENMKERNKDMMEAQEDFYKADRGFRLREHRGASSSNQRHGSV